MRHRVAGRKLSRSFDHRRALRRNLVKALFQLGRIRTTEAKAKAIRDEAEELITLARKGHLHARRQALARLGDSETVHKLFAELGPEYQERPGGYIRILKLGPRQGDGAQMAIIELVGKGRKA